MQSRNIVVLGALVIIVGGLVWWGVQRNTAALMLDPNSDAQIEQDLSIDLGNLDADFAEIDEGIDGL